MQNDHDKIRERAYEIWDRDGRQDGRAQEHWSQAERELGVSTGNVVAGAKNKAVVPGRSRPKGNGASQPVAAKPPAKSAEALQRKRRGSQPLSQA